MEKFFIDPVKDFGPLLLEVEKPGRYTGGEYGRLCNPELNKKESSLKTAIAFPDLYEIGMSNQALRIIYNNLNNIEGISCDRAFVPAPDFEELLKAQGFPLYGLDTGINLKKTDLLMFTFGYELLFSGILTILDISGIPLRCCNRQDDDPIIIMGGPCVSNPLPFCNFIDAFWIGEAEGGFFDLARELRDIKRSGLKRQALYEKILSHPSIWTKGKGRALRAIDAEFSEGKRQPAVNPIPSIKVVQNHGSVEIMRGCPNGCRFCHAGYWYRPMRQKNADQIEKEAEAFIHLGGYREITLSSLSSGDYQYLDCLLERLNSKYQAEHVSFQLPSLKVSTFSLGLIEKISRVRKSGLTFAVETPLDFWQMAINKQVSCDDIVTILLEAKRHGWKGAKFYFMIGLPLGDIEFPGNDFKNSKFKPEEAEIAAFIERVSRKTGMHFNITISAFVPKPHTPFQWVKQIDREEAGKKYAYLLSRLKMQGHKVGIQDPLISVIEGILCRGDERAGDILEEAYFSGCRLDAWNDHIKKNIWEEILKKYELLVGEFLDKKAIDSQLPWNIIDSGINSSYFSREFEKSNSREITSACINNCNKTCHICKNNTRLVKNNIQIKEISQEEKLIKSNPALPDPDTYRILFSFSKQNTAIFHPHLGLIEIFFMAFIRAKIPVLYTRGFNPLPHLEIASPLSLGIRARNEIAAIDTISFFDAEIFKEELNKYLPEGFEIKRAINIMIPGGSKKFSVSSLLWGFEYAGENGKIDIVRAKEEKKYRTVWMGMNRSVYGLERISLLSKNISKNGEGEGESYFKVYETLYPQTNNQTDV